MRTGWEEVAEMLSRVSAASAGTDPWRSRRACAQAPGCVLLVQGNCCAPPSEHAVLGTEALSIP